MNNGNTPPASMVAPAAPVAPVPMEQFTAMRKKRDDGKIYLIVGLVVACVALAVFIGLFIWMFIRYDEVSTDVEGQINEAKAIAINENSQKLEAEFAEREKEPNKTFSGPEDYGELSFQYPKTWSVFIQTDAAKGGNFQAYFSVDAVQPITATTPNALRLTITTQTFESTVQTYASYVSSGRMKMNIITINGATANYYEGTLPSGLNGAVCLIKIRDKTVVLQTDSELYLNDFKELLNTITYNS